ncbi:MAG: hypothetical protein C0592_09745 [Marinilabiliales bacterium]|nr:MAG: hypothetical protein C0592_09745 [Marinilabiliales bacterium]
MMVGILYTPIHTSAQSVGVSNAAITPDASSMFEVRATNKGVLIPRVALTSILDVATIAAPATSLLVYNTATAGVSPNNVVPGYYYWDGAKWERFFTGAQSDDWRLLGNAGTSPATNFLGTTDAQDLVFRTNNTEWMRMLSTGYIVAHDVAPANSAVFSAYGGYGGVDGQGLSFGVLGISDTSGVFGIGDYRGVLGISADGDGGQFFALETAADNAGVYGACDVSDYYGFGGYFSGGYVGVYGTVAPTGADVYFGVRGDVTGGTGSNYGVAGTSDYVGVYGSADGHGVQGWGGSVGVYGSVDFATGFGVEGINEDPSGTGVLGAGNNVGGIYLTSGTGGAFTGDAGSFSYSTDASGTGVIGIGNSGAAVNTLTNGSGGAFNGNDGVYGKATGATGNGIVGVGNNGANIYTLTNGSGGAFTGQYTGVYGVSISTSYLNSGGYFEQGTTGTVYSYIATSNGPPPTNYGILSNGVKSTVVKDLNDQPVTMFCTEAPEVLFQDYGTGQLVNGKAHIELDPIFSKNIYTDEDHPIKIFVQLEGNCNGVYVTNKTINGFDVIELNNGSSNVQFSYTVVANRADDYKEDGTLNSTYSTIRFPSAPGFIPRKQKEENSLELNNNTDQKSVNTDGTNNQVIPGKDANYTPSDANNNVQNNMNK